SASVVITKPDGTTLVSATVTPGTTGVQLPALPATGAYMIRIDPGSHSGSLTLALLSPTTTTATVGGAAVTLNMTPAGQRALVTFNGTAGQYLTLALPTFLTFSGTITVTTPSGTVLNTTSGTSINRVQLPVLPATGTYTILADPGSAAESVSLTI